MDAKKKDREQQLVRSPFVFALPFSQNVLDCFDVRMQILITPARRRS
jgi:hypothetical protein